MLSCKGLNLSVLRGMALLTTWKSDGSEICIGLPICGLRERMPLYAFNFLLTEKAPRFDTVEA